MSSEEIILDENLEGETGADENFEIASTGARFGNYVLDLIAYYVVVFALSFLAGGLSVALSDGSLVDSMASGSGQLWIQLVSVIVYILYYTILESTTGRSIGKFVTGTKVVTVHGEKPDFGKALLRSLSRAVPFGAFSAFSSSGRMWHDKWTDTYVIKVRK